MRRMISRNPLSDAFEKVVRENLELWKVPGVSVAVVDGDNVWAKGYGTAKFPDSPMTPSSLVYAGSTTKAFTAAAMSILVNDNEKYPQVQWNTPISQLIRDDFVLPDEYATNHVTVEDILSHRTGLPRHDQAYGGVYDGHSGTVKDIVRSLRHLPLTAEPRTTYQYCNLMFVVAAHVIETLTGEWLGDFLKKHIWEPLGMNSTYFSKEDAVKSNDELAVGYKWEDGKYVELPLMELHEVSGAGSVISNVLDYAKWAQALMNPEKKINGRKCPLSKETIDELWGYRTLITPTETPFTGPKAYSLGWNHSIYHGHHLVRHGGGMNSFGTDFILFPDLKYSVISFGNTAGTSNLVETAILFHLIDEKLTVAPERRFDWNKKAEANIREAKEKVENAVSEFYPKLPSQPLPLTLDLSDYVGKYFHPGYRTVSIYLDSKSKSSRLRADRDEVTFPEYFSFEHVSGNYFLIRVDGTGDFTALYPTIYPAEFKIGSDGKPSALGIRWEKQMGDEKIWLERVKED